MSAIPLVSASITSPLHQRIARYVATLPEAVQLRLARSTPAEAAQLLVRMGAYGPGGLGDAPAGLGWINFVIQAAAAIYGAKKSKDAKKKAKKQAAQQEQQARAEAAAAAAQEAAAKKSADEARARAAAVRAQQQQAKQQTTRRNYALLGIGALVLGGGALWFFTRKRGRK